MSCHLYLSDWQKFFTYECVCLVNLLEKDKASGPTLYKSIHHSMVRMSEGITFLTAAIFCPRTLQGDMSYPSLFFSALPWVLHALLFPDLSPTKILAALLQSWGFVVRDAMSHVAK